MISKGRPTFQDLKQLIFHYFIYIYIYIYISLSSEWNVFSSGGKLVVNFDDMTTD